MARPDVDFVKPKLENFRVAAGKIGVYPVGALSLSFFESLAADVIVGRANSATSSWVQERGRIALDGRTLEVGGLFRRGLAGPGLPELILACPWADQLGDLLEELVDYFRVLDAGVPELEQVPYLLLASSGIYFEDVLEDAGGKLARAGLEHRAFFERALERRLFRAVVYQAGTRRGRGPGAEYRSVRSAGHLVLSASGEPSDRERVLALLRARDYDSRLESRFLEAEYDKAAINATISAFSQVYSTGAERLVDVRCGDLIASDPRLPAGFEPRPLAEDAAAVAGRINRVGRALVDVGRARRVYDDRTTFDSILERAKADFLLKIAEHLPSSVQLLADRIGDPDEPWPEGGLLPTEAHIVGPLLRRARAAGLADATVVLEDLRARLRAATGELRKLRERPEPVLERLSRGSTLGLLEEAVLAGALKGAAKGWAAALGVSDLESYAREHLAAFSACAPAAGAPSLTDLWLHYLPLARRALALKEERPGCFVLGVHGLPGVGKSTSARVLASVLAALRPAEKVALVSIDDFYLRGEERRRLGLTRWAIGAHDMALAGRLHRLKAGETTLLPRFDKRRRERVETDERIEGPVDWIVFEGFGVGLTSRGYDAFSSAVDYRIALKCDLALSRAWRCEAGWAQRSTALSGDRAAWEREFADLWDGVKDQFEWVPRAAEAAADLTIEIGRDHRPLRYTARPA